MRRRLTRRVGRNTAAFIISMSAVPPAMGRTDGSSGSIRSSASLKERGSASSNGVTSGSLRGGARPAFRRRKMRLQALGELLFHVLGLRTQHRLADTAELAGQGRLGFVAHLGVLALLQHLEDGSCRQSPHDSRWYAFDFRLDLARRI